MRSTQVSLVFVLAQIALADAYSQETDPVTEDTTPAKEVMVVWGRSLDLSGTALSASQGVVGYADFQTRPLLRPGELVEVIPGLAATQHSGTGKANQYFLRGFNLDHGTDFSATFEGMPVNFPTHGHGQGYLDLNFIIPEIVERVEYRKGPYYADVGDFSAAGTVFFKTYDRLAEGFAEATVGEYGFYRGVLADSFELASGDLLYAAEVQFYDGPWVLDEDLEKYNALVKWTGKTGGFDTQIIATGYYSDWTSTDQIPRRAVRSGAIDRFGFIDPDLGGETTRVNLIASTQSDAFEGTAFVSYYDFTLYSNFTYLLNDPVNGDEFEQRDNRVVYGANGVYKWDTSLLDRKSTIRTGGEVRVDDIDQVGLFMTAGRERLGTVRDDTVLEIGLAAYSDIEIKWTDRLRTTVGARIDHYIFDVEAEIAANSGDGSDTIVSPKFALAYLFAPKSEFYINYGRGFHSNDVRGATIARDPVTGDPVDRVETLVKAEGAELGLRASPIENITATVAVFYLDLDSELVFVGDAGTTEPNDGTRRYGAEASVFWQPFEWLVFDGQAAVTNARFKGDPPGGDYIPNAVSMVAGGGATVLLDTGFTGSVRVRHVDEAPLIEDNSVRSEATTLVNLGLSYDVGFVELALDVFNILNAQDADITYFYESQLEGEAAPVEDVHFHPVEPRAIRGSVKIRF